MRIWIAFFGLLFAAFSGARADGIYLAGASRGATSEYAFLGAIVPLPGQGVGSGFAARIWGDYLGYTYRTGNQTITAAGFGGAVAGVYQFSGDWGWANLSAGMTFRDLRLSMFDPGNRDRGAHGYFAAQIDGGYNIDEKWRVRHLASYTPTTNGYLLQLGLDRELSTSLRLGLTSSFQGDRNYTQMSGGAIAFWQISPGLEIAPGIGVSHGDGSLSLYGGVTLVLIVN
jgi:hypothetical protein